MLSTIRSSTIKSSTARPSTTRFSTTAAPIATDAQSLHVGEHLLAASAERRNALFYLVYSLFYFFPLLFMGDYLDTRELWWWLALFAIYAAFLAIYFSITYTNRAMLSPLLAGMLILSTLGTFVAVGTSAFFAYCAFYVCFLLSGRERIVWSGLTLAGIAIGALITDFAWYFWVIALGVSIVNAANAVIEQQRLKQAGDECRIASLEGRDRLASDLHDVTGHHLVAIALKAQLTKKLIEGAKYDQAQHELDAICRLASENRSAIRRAIEGDLPENATEVFADLVDLLQQNGFIIKTVGAPPAFHPDCSAEIAAIFSEAFTNILRHALKPEVSWSHAVTPAGYVWRAINPVDSQPQHPIKHAATALGLGLKSMAQRAENLGGSCEFAISPRGEAELVFKLPPGCIGDHQQG